MIAKTMNPRAAYAGELLLTSERTESMDSWATGLNNNVLVLGCSGAGKTRNFLKPNLLQCHGSYVVLDSKGRLFYEMVPHLSDHGYAVDRLDFTTMEGTIGYDPLHHVRWRRGRPLAQDIIGIASALFPRDEMGDDPFWASAAANYVASYIAYVFEALPDREWNMASVVSVFEQACEGNIEQLFCDLRRQDPESYAVSLFRRARSTARAEKMHSSIMGIIAANLMPLTFDGALASFRKPEKIAAPVSTSSGGAPLVAVEKPEQGRSQNTQQQTRQKRRTTDARPRTTAPRKTSIPTTTEQFQLLGRRPHGRLLLFRDLAAS